MTIDNKTYIAPKHGALPHTPGKWGRLAWLPIPLSIATIAVLWVADLRVVWPLLPLHWVIHYGSVVFAVALIIIPAARSFLANGQSSVLMLGCGTLVAQIAVPVATIGYARGLDTYFAIYNTAILFSALCHFIGMAITARRKIRLSQPAKWLAFAYLGSMAVMGLVIWLAFTGRMPEFFIEGQGGTLLRSLVVGAAVAFFLLTADLLWQTYRRAALPFFRWYSLGLVLLAVGLAGSMMIVVKDSPLQWVTRSTQFLGVIYMCVAVFASMRESSAKWIPLSAVDETWRDDSVLAGFRKQTTMGWMLRYCFAVVVVAAAMGLRLSLEAWVGPGLPAFITFYPAIMVVALLAGLGPGLAATALASFIVAYWILPPIGQFSIDTPMDRVSLVLFCGMGIFMSAISGLYRRNRNKAAAYEREEAMREIQREKAFLADLLEHSSQAFAAGYPDGQLGRFNPAFEQLTGYTAAELRTLDWSAILTPPEWRAIEKQKLDGLQLTGQPVRYEKEYIRKDGSRVPVELLVHLARDAEGKPEYYYAFVTDITERKKAEHALRQSEERYRTLFNAQINGFCIIEVIFDSDNAPVDYRFIEINPAFEAQTGLHNAQGKLMRELAPEHEAHWFEIYGKVALTGEPASFENAAEALQRWFEVYAYRVDMPEDRHVAIIFNDITIRRQAEEKVRRHVEDLQIKNTELERANRVMIGRELRMIELKKEVNELCARAGEPLRYKGD